MPLATTTDVAARLGAAFDTTDPGAVEHLLEVASDLAEGWMRCAPDPVPPQVTRVVAGMVARALSVDPATPVGMTQHQTAETAGQMGITRSASFSEDATSRGPWLTRADKIILRRFGCRGRVRNVPTA